VSLVGYTNAGKSTLFNALTGAGTYAADQLFATLDTLTRRTRLAGGPELVLSDTVGFVRQLPHTLIEAFRATLEETRDADLLLHVVDASAPDRDDQIAEVARVLAEIGADHVPMLMVYNKIDAAGWSPEVLRDPCGSIIRLGVSARSGAGLDELRLALEETLVGRGPGDPQPPEPVAAGAPGADSPQHPQHTLQASLPDEASLAEDALAPQPLLLPSPCGSRSPGYSP
jgi:GTP-binding protein HflX